MRTHVLFSAGIAVYVAVKLLGVGLLAGLVLAGSVGVMQYVIDFLSHEEAVVRTKRGAVVVSRRGWFLHSPIGATAVALVFTLIDAYVMHWWAGFASILAVALAGSYSHLLLDMITEKGIYLYRRRLTRKRLFRYDNPALNALFSIAGVVMIVLAFT